MGLNRSLLWHSRSHSNIEPSIANFFKQMFLSLCHSLIQTVDQGKNRKKRFSLQVYPKEISKNLNNVTKTPPPQPKKKNSARGTTF